MPLRKVLAVGSKGYNLLGTTEDWYHTKTEILMSFSCISGKQNKDIYFYG